MRNKRIRRNDRVWFTDSGNWKKQGLVEKTTDKLMYIILDGYAGKVVHTAKRKNGRWYAYGYEKNDYALEIHKI